LVPRNFIEQISFRYDQQQFSLAEVIIRTSSKVVQSEMHLLDLQRFHHSTSRKQKQEWLQHFNSDILKLRIYRLVV